VGTGKERTVGGGLLKRYGDARIAMNDTREESDSNSRILKEQ